MGLLETEEISSSGFQTPAHYPTKPTSLMCRVLIRKVSSLKRLEGVFFLGVN